MTGPDLHLTRVRINPRNSTARSDLRSAISLHRTVMSMFPDVPDSAARSALGVLHRLDATGSGPVLLLQSVAVPNIEALPDGYGDTRVTSLGALLVRLRSGTPVRYRIVVNATKKVGSGEQAGKRIALGAGPTKLWWVRRADAAGLDLAEEPILVSTSITGSDDIDGRVTLRPWQVDGVAEVRDPALLTAAIREGIGRGKAYGCGLLTLALL